MPRTKRPSAVAIREQRALTRQRAADADLRFPDGIRDLRESLGWTQQQLAQAVGLATRKISEIETGKANPTIETLMKILKPFGLTVGLVPIRAEAGLGPQPAPRKSN